MATDVKLDEVDGTFVVIDSRVTKLTSSDFMLDSPARRKRSNPHRRALVHDQNDGLTVNFGGDYPGGVTVSGATTTIGGTLLVLGGISYQARGTTAEIPPPGTGGGSTTITVNLDSVLATLKADIIQLRAKVAALEARIK